MTPERVKNESLEARRSARRWVASGTVQNPEFSRMRFLEETKPARGSCVADRHAVDPKRTHSIRVRNVFVALFQLEEHRRQCRGLKIIWGRVNSSASVRSTRFAPHFDPLRVTILSVRRGGSATHPRGGTGAREGGNSSSKVTARKSSPVRAGKFIQQKRGSKEGAPAILSIRAFAESFVGRRASCTSDRASFPLFLPRSRAAHCLSPPLPVFSTLCG